MSDLFSGLAIQACQCKPALMLCFVSNWLLLLIKSDMGGQKKKKEVLTLQRAGCRRTRAGTFLSLPSHVRLYLQYDKLTFPDSHIKLGMQMFKLPAYCSCYWTSYTCNVSLIPHLSSPAAAHLQQLLTLLSSAARSLSSAMLGGTSSDGWGPAKPACQFHSESSVPYQAWHPKRSSERA